MRHPLITFSAGFSLFIIGCNAPIQKEPLIQNKKKIIPNYSDLHIAKSLDKRWAKDDQRRLLKNSRNNTAIMLKSDSTNLTMKEKNSGGGSWKNTNTYVNSNDKSNIIYEEETPAIESRKTRSDADKKNDLLLSNNEKKPDSLSSQKEFKPIATKESNSRNHLQEKKDVELPKPKKIKDAALFDITSLDPSDAKRFVVGKWDRIAPPNLKGDFFVGGWKKEEIHFDKNGYLTVIRFFGKNTSFKSTCDYTVHSNKKISLGQKTRPEKMNKPITMYHDPEMPTLRPPTQNLPVILPFKRKDSILIIDGINYKIKTKISKKPTAP